MLICSFRKSFCSLILFKPFIYFSYSRYAMYFIPKVILLNVYAVVFDISLCGLDLDFVGFFCFAKNSYFFGSKTLCFSPKHTNEAIIKKKDKFQLNTVFAGK